MTRITPAEAAARYNAGESITAIRALLGGDLYKVRDILVAQGCRIRSPGRRKKDGTLPTARKEASVEEMVAMYTGGMTVYEIASNLETSHQNVCHFFKRNGVDLQSLVRPPKPFVPNAKQQEILSAYQSGMQTKDICMQFSISKGQLQLLREKAGIEALPLGHHFRSDPTFQHRNKVVAERYTKGDKTDDIAAELGIAPTAIPKILRRQGLVPNRMPNSGRWSWTREAQPA